VEGGRAGGALGTAGCTRKPGKEGKMVFICSFENLEFSKFLKPRFSSNPGYFPTFYSKVNFQILQHPSFFSKSR